MNPLKLAPRSQVLRGCPEEPNQASQQEQNEGKPHEIRQHQVRGKRLSLSARQAQTKMATVEKAFKPCQNGYG
jgi:hypothetical protein